jgi:hypothetical protein
MPRNLDDKAIREFWDERASRRGGPVELFSFAVCLGAGAGGMPPARTGVAYVAAGTLWFETVPTNATIMGLGTGGEREGTEAFEFGIPLDDVARVDIVSEKAARGYASGKMKAGLPPALSALESFFSPRVMMLTLRDGSATFLELAKEKEFLGFFKGRSG